MATLLIGAAKGYTTLVGFGLIFFGVRMAEVRVDMEEFEDAVEIEEVQPEALQIIPADPAE